MTYLGPHLGNSLLSPLLWAIAHSRPGTALEFGVASGTTLGLLADCDHLDPVVGFDSFQGLPENWRPGWPAGKFARKPPTIPGANLVIGLYADTLPALVGDPEEGRRLASQRDDLILSGANPADLAVPLAPHVPGWLLDLSLVHIDCDLYSSTATVLEHIGPYFSKGMLLAFDEYHGYDGCEDHEQRAWLEYVEASGTDWEPVGHGPEQLVVRIG